MNSGLNSDAFVDDLTSSMYWELSIRGHRNFPVYESSAMVRGFLWISTLSPNRAKIMSE